LAIVWAITLIRGASFVEAIRQPTFWLVEGATMAIAVFVVLSESGGNTATTRSPTRRVATQVAWTAVAAIAIGTLLAIATDTPIGQLLTSTEFLIPAGIALAVAALEAWPNSRPESG
jgi:hypothetical protein